MNLGQIKKLNIPTAPGCYQYFDKDKQLLYIGKAANLNKRVLSYWRTSANHTPAKKAMLSKIAKIKWLEVGSEIEALLLEANLIKKFQPPYNVVLRDDKRHIYIKITVDEWPRVIATRAIGKDGRYFGPFISASAVRETIKIIGRVWPYGGFITMPADKNSSLKSRRYPELYGSPTDGLEYKKIIKEIEAFLEGRRSDIEKNLQLSIIDYQAEAEKTKDEEIFKKISSLKYRLLNLKKVLAHSNILSISDKYAADVIELAKILSLPKTPKRIEGYDISNIFGQEAVGSMVVFANGEPDKNQYRKFIIKGGDYCQPNKTITSQKITSGLLRHPASGNQRKNDDTAMLKEILERRFNNDWPLPDLIIIDGGKGQLNAGLAILKKFQNQLRGKKEHEDLKFDIPIMSVSKGEGRRSAGAPDKIFFPQMKTALQLPFNSPALHIIKRVRDEAHRFAITFHRQKKIKKLLGR